MLYIFFLFNLIFIFYQQKLHVKIVKKATEFNQVEGNIETKHKLFQTACMEILDDISTISKIPPCNEDEHQNFEYFIRDVTFAEQQYKSMLTFKEPEYQGFIKMRIKKNKINFKECDKLITRTAADGERNIFDVCR